MWDKVLGAILWTHQDSYKAVYSNILVAFNDGEDMSNPTIRTDFNGPFLYFKSYIADATYDWEVRYGAGGHPKSAIFMAVTSL